MLEGADAATVSDGPSNAGSVRSAASARNHFLEVQTVERVYDTAAATHMGLAEGTVC